MKKYVKIRFSLIIYNIEFLIFSSLYLNLESGFIRQPECILARHYFPKQIKYLSQILVPAEMLLGYYFTLTS